MSRIQIRKIVLCLWIWVLAGTGYAAPNSKSGKLTLEKRGKITGLQLDESDMQFTQRLTERGRQEFVLIKARYIRNRWKIVVNGKKIVATKDGSFSLDIKVDYKDGLIKILALGPNSEVEELQLVIRKNSAQPQDLKSKKNPNSFEASLGLDAIPQFNYLTPRFELNYSLRVNEAVARRVDNEVSASNPKYSLDSGFKFVQYKQSYLPDVSALLLNTRAAFTHELKYQKYDLGCDVQVALPLFFPSGAAHASFFNFEARLGYQAPATLIPNWPIRIDASVYFDTMKVEGASYGYKNLVGFLLKPELRHSFGAGTLDVFMKFAMSLNDFPRSLGSGEYTLGSRWHMRDLKDLFLFSEVSYLRLKIGEVLVTNTSFVLGAGLSFY
jgi:hypothetical protein